MRERSPDLNLPPRCHITQIDYAGDEDGIIWELHFGNENTREVFFASITHLALDRRLPLAREIAAYHQHRIKRLQASPTGAASSGIPP